MEPSAYQDEYSIDDLESVDLGSEATKGLALSQVRFIKAKVLDVNEASGVAGNAIRAAARALVDIKKDVKRKNWIALCESGALSMSSRNAQDLANAYESWLAFANVPEAVLSQVSFRTLAKIGKVDSAKRGKAIEVMMHNQGLSESDLNKILKKPVKKANWDDLIKETELAVESKSSEEKLEGYPKIVFENLRLKKRIRELEDELAKVKEFVR